jgi:hypothetical protein
MEDKRFDIEFEVVTPLSVGAGNDNDWMRGIDYIQKDGKVYVLDIKKAVEQGIDIERLTSLFDHSDEKGISILIGNKIEDVSRLIFNSPVYTTNAIKSFLRTQLFGKPIVAGSSLKGSVRSALFQYLRDNERTNEEVFGNIKDGTDFMRFVHIADIEMPKTILVNTKLFNLQKDGTEWTGGWKHAMSETTRQYRPTGFNTLYECVAPKQKGLGSISLSGRAFEVMASNTDKFVSQQGKKQKLLAGGITELFKVINQVTKGYLLKEKAFFEKYTAERSDELIDCVNSLLDMIPEDGSYCLLKMSAGVGFHSITGDWQFDDYSQTGIWTEGRNSGKKKYKSRKTADYNGHLQLMGFVKLRSLNADEAAQRTQSLDAEHADIIESIVAPVKLRDEERKKRLEEEQNRQLAAEEERKRQKLCQGLLDQAQQLYNDKLWDDAISKAEEAKSICPDNTSITSLIENIKKEKELEEYRQSEQAASAQRFGQPLAEVIKGKTSAGNLIGTTVKWLKDKSFGDEELKALVNEAKQLPSKEQKKLKSKRNDLLKAIGEEWTEKFYNEIE